MLSSSLKVCITAHSCLTRCYYTQSNHATATRSPRGQVQERRAYWFWSTRDGSKSDAHLFPLNKCHDCTRRWKTRQTRRKLQHLGKKEDFPERSSNRCEQMCCCEAWRGACTSWMNAACLTHTNLPHGPSLLLWDSPVRQYWPAGSNDEEITDTSCSWGEYGKETWHFKQKEPSKK